MAARTGAGTGVVVALVVFVLSTIFLLILTIVFYSREQRALQARDQAQADLQRFVKPLEQSSEKVKAILNNSGSQSAMGYLIDQRERLLTKVVGNSSADITQLSTTLQNYGGGANDSFRAVLDSLQAEIRQRKQEASGAQATVQELEQRLAEKDALIEQTARSGQADVEAIKALIDQYSQDVVNYATSTEETKRHLHSLYDQAKRLFDSQVDTLERQLDDVRADLATSNRRLAEMQEKLGTYAQHMQTNPSLLVDGVVIDNARENQVFVNRGKRDHISVGMTFEVYDNAAQLGIDEFGNIIAGKASIQVISVQDTTSTAAITRSSPGRPIVKNDVIANAIYDPAKTFLFLVHGKFDFNGDGRATDYERTTIEDLVANWGGKVAPGDAIRGDLDFLVLGEQPPQPPPLRENATEVEIDIWVQQKAAVDKYDQLMRDAMEAGIPVLNQNRFFVLIGHTYQ